MKRAALALGIAGLLYAVFHLRAEAPRESLRAAGWIEAIPAADAKVVLYSIRPQKADFPDEAKGGTFHGFPILGQAKIVSPQERAGLLGTLAAAARATRAGETKCFNPRHALRVETPSGTADFVICFQCHLVSAYGADPLNIFLIGGTPDGFNRALAAHGLPVQKAD